MASLSIARKQQYLDPRWQKKRLEILGRDDFTCQSCGCTDRTLHVHHLYYEVNAEGPWDYENFALLTLCDACHENEHDNMPHQKNNLVAFLAEAGFRTFEEVEGFLCFIDTMRCGSRSQNDRATAIDFMLDYWEKNGAYEGARNETNT